MKEQIDWEQHLQTAEVQNVVFPESMAEFSHYAQQELYSLYIPDDVVARIEEASCRIAGVR